MISILYTGSVHDCCGNYFGSGSSGVIINDLTCDGSENRLVDCTHTIADDFHAAGCYHRDDIVIRCYRTFEIVMPILQCY